jgi:hypothetical protein
VGFLDWLGSLFGGGQKPADPPAPSNSSFGGLRPAPPAPPPMLARPAPAPAPARDPFRPQSAPSFIPFPSLPAPAPPPSIAAPAAPTTGPWRPINFAPPPENAPPPPSLQAPQPEGLSFRSGQKEAEKQVEQKKAASQQNNYFGDQASYAPKEMSVDAYLTLTPIQRAAVDANTALVQAAEQDVASWAKQQVAGKAIDDKDYLNQVKDKFGETGGSDTYAPRTMAVLEDLGLNLQGKDLDQYLNHSALVTDADLKLLGAPTANTAIPGIRPEDPRQGNAVAFADAASNRLSETLAVGQNLLDSLRTGSEKGPELFGKPTTAAPVGFAQNNERDADLAQAFDILAQTRSQQDLTPETVGGLYAELQQKHGVTPNEVAQYFETRLESNEYLNAAQDSDVKLGGPGSSLDYLSPQDFRSKFLKRGE